MLLYTPGWYVIYNVLFMAFLSLSINEGVALRYETVLLLAVAAVAIALICFLLQGFGLYKMAKNTNRKHKWMAFVPFVNLLYAGMLSGEVSFFGHRFKRAGLVAMIFQIILTLFCLAMAFAEIVLFVYYFDRLAVSATEAGTLVVEWIDLPTAALPIKNFYYLSDYIFPIVSLVQSLFILLLYTGLFRRYNPRRSAVLAFLCVFIPFFPEITTFVLRNRKAIDYEAYVRARREEHQRRQQQRYGQYPYGQNPYGGNPYGNNPYGNNPYGQNGGNPYGQNPYGNNPYGQNPYGNNPYGNNPYGQNPYGQNPYGQQGRPNDSQSRPPEDPFAEFSENNTSQQAGGNENSTATNGGSSADQDDLFN